MTGEQTEYAEDVNAETVGMLIGEVAQHFRDGGEFDTEAVGVYLTAMLHAKIDTTLDLLAMASITRMLINGLQDQHEQQDGRVSESLLDAAMKLNDRMIVALQGDTGVAVEAFLGHSEANN